MDNKKPPNITLRGFILCIILPTKRPSAKQQHGAYLFVYLARILLGGIMNDIGISVLRTNSTGLQTIVRSGSMVRPERAVPPFVDGGATKRLRPIAVVNNHLKRNDIVTLRTKHIATPFVHGINTIKKPRAFILPEAIIIEKQKPKELFHHKLASRAAYAIHINALGIGGNVYHNFRAVAINSAFLHKATFHIVDG